MHFGKRYESLSLRQYFPYKSTFYRVVRRKLRHFLGFESRCALGDFFRQMRRHRKGDQAREQASKRSTRDALPNYCSIGLGTGLDGTIGQLTAGLLWKLQNGAIVAFEQFTDTLLVHRAMG